MLIGYVSDGHSLALRGDRVEFKQSGAADNTNSTITANALHEALE